MSDVRRHSVDIPLSKTLVALKRVRSLRDPATNSFIKFPAFAENLNWETRSSNEQVLESCDDNRVQARNSLHDGKNEEYCSDSASARSSRVHGPNLSSTKRSLKHRLGGSDSTKTKQVSESCGEYNNKKFDSYVELFEEEAASYGELNLDVLHKVNATDVSKKTGRSSLRNPPIAENVDRSCSESPCLSSSLPQTHLSSPSILELPYEEGNVMHPNQNGCGLGSCWSRTPKYRDPSHVSDGEDQNHPLLPAEGRENTFKQMTPYLDSPRSLSQKFRPRSFTELVGQNLIVQSLINAISKGKVAPVYLFHGPRGTGKTSMARIFAAALNCLSFKEQIPCGFCRECVFFFSGRSRDIKELDSAKINCKGRVKALLKSASLLPFSSRYKVFIVDECQFLHRETWDLVLKNLEEFSRHVVFIMVTSDLDRIPQSSLYRCQRYHFLKIKDEDIMCRLRNICAEEYLDFDNDALRFIAAKSGGSLRDAETMLDQLSLLGKRITVYLAYELIGVVSDDELLELLDLALSSDTSNTVKRARDLMSSRVDPMQLASQLANLIMDILAGRCQSGDSEVARRFFGRHTCEAGPHKLRHALKILSETEKQLRTSKNQATWLTVALLQFSSGEFSSVADIDDTTALLQTSCYKDGVLCRTLSTRQSLKCDCNHGQHCCFEGSCSATNKLETIWTRAIEICQSDSHRSFLKKGRLSSIHVRQGLAIAEVDFFSHECVSKAEKLCQLIANSLRLVLGHDVKVRINVSRPFTTVSKVKELTLRLLSCSGKRQCLAGSNMIDENENETSSRKEIYCELYSPEKCSESVHERQIQMDTKQPGNTSYDNETSITIENANNNALVASATRSEQSANNGSGKGCKLDFTVKGTDEDGQCLSIQDSENQSSCFARTMRLQKKFFSSDSAHSVSSGIEPQIEVELSIPKKGTFETYFCSKDPYVLCSKPKAHQSCSSGEDDRPRNDPELNSTSLCWSGSKFSVRKVRQKI